MNNEPTIGRLCMLMVTLIDEVRGLRADLAGRSRAAPSTLSDADRVILEEVLPAVTAIFGDGEFRVGELMKRAADGTAGKRAKRAIGTMNALSLGRLLKRAAAVELPVSDLYVHFVRRSRMGAVFCVDANTAENRMASSFATKMRENLPI